MVVCSRVDPTAKVVHDPVVIFEVLSPSTAAKDRIVKAREYQATPSVKRYVMLEQERIGATVLVRAQDGWSALILKDDDTLDMPEIGLAIPLAEFYEGLAFEAQPVEDNDTAAARHRLIGFLTDRFPDAGRLGSPPRRPLPHARFVLRHDRRHPVPMLYEERSSESRCGTSMSEIDRDLHSLTRGRAPAEARPRLRDPRIYRPLRSRRRNQAGRSGIAARKARPLPETLCLLERRPGADRPRQE